MTTVSNSGTTSVTDLMSSMNGTKKKAADGSVEAETNKFLTLLVTQLQNQDPMNPLDNAQLTSQLAQLSTVTGINTLNDTLDSLKASYQSSESMQAANLIGHGVLTPGKSLALEKSAAIMGIDLATAADSVKVVIRDSAGKEVHSIDLGAQPAGSIPLGWDGSTGEKGDDGKNIVLADGDYTFEVQATRGGVALKDATALMFGAVNSVSTGTAGVKLNVSGVGSISMADVKQVL